MKDVPRRCFQGVIPAVICTAGPDATPNVTYLSQVHYVDERHVALSCQFFNKTKQNIAQNPNACVMLHDPVTFESYRLELRFDHEEGSGPLFDEIALRIQAIASHTGMTGVFALRSADVYEVLSCEKVAAFLDVPDVPTLDDPGGERSELRALQVVSQRACRAETLEQLFAGVLESLEETLGFAHVMCLISYPAERPGQAPLLRVAATRGYPASFIGVEVASGEGVIGTVAAGRRPLRVAGIEDDLRYGRAVRNQLAKTAGSDGVTREIPLCGLPDAQSQLALPLLVGERLLGVIASESRNRLAFDEWDETFLEIVANQVATRVDALLRRGGEPAVAPRRFRFFAHDDCVFVDDDYLVRNLPGRILWKLLREHVESGRTEFSNRELRLDPWLGLPAIRDNLESRLSLLRKRLSERCPELALESTSRGHFRLVARCRIELSEASETQLRNA